MGTLNQNFDEFVKARIHEVFCVLFLVFRKKPYNSMLCKARNTKNQTLERKVVF